MKTSCEIAKYFHDKICKIAKKYKIKLVDLEREFQINTVVDCACDFCDIKEEEEEELPDAIKSLLYGKDWNKSGDESDYDSDEYEEITCNKIEVNGKTYLLDICTKTVYNYEYPHDEVLGLDIDFGGVHGPCG
jgi:hypothetical protein